jgi:large subunit ribosomal protein L9
VEVADGYARNYLLPRELAVRAEEADMQAIEQARAARRARERAELTRVGDLADKLDGFLCYIQARATEQGHLYGSVGAQQVADTLVHSGFETVRPANIIMSRPIETVGDHEVEVMLHPDVAVHITVRVSPVEEEEEG